MKPASGLVPRRREWRRRRETEDMRVSCAGTLARDASRMTEGTRIGARFASRVRAARGARCAVRDA
jgi:hypothetical protein